MAKAITREEIQAYYDQDQQRKTAQRGVDAIERAMKPTKEKLTAHLEENGGADRTCICQGFVLSFIDRGANVGWKDEFIKATSIAKSLELQESAPRRLSLSVEPAAVKAAP